MCQGIILSRNCVRVSKKNIIALHSIQREFTDNLQAPQINDLKLENLINIRDPEPQELFVESLRMFDTKFIQSLNGKYMQCNLNEAVEKLKNPDTREWKFMNVTKNVTLWDEESGLYQIVNNTFHSKKHNIITGSVYRFIIFFVFKIYTMQFPF